MVSSINKNINYLYLSFYCEPVNNLITLYAKLICKSGAISEYLGEGVSDKLIYPENEQV